MDRAENVCSDPDILAREIEHLSKVLHYNQLPTVDDQTVRKVGENKTLKQGIR